MGVGNRFKWRRSESSRWPRNDLIALGILLATIAAVVVPVVLADSAGGKGKGEAQTHGPVVALRNVSFSPSSVSVAGTATGVPPGEDVYAIARAAGAGRWYAASAVPVHPDGDWTAVIPIDPPVTSKLKVIALTAEGETPPEAGAAAEAEPGSSSEGSGGSAEAPAEVYKEQAEPPETGSPTAAAPSLPTRLEMLAEEGPSAGGVGTVSKPVTGTPK
jgi:hypothetical protein